MPKLNKIVTNLNELTNEELQKLKQEVLERINLKRGTKHVIYTHACYGSSNYHFRKYKHFSKLITSIDDTKSNGYAFNGEFLLADKENLIKDGSFVVEVCDCSLSLYKVEADGIKLVLQGNSRRYVSFIQEAKRLTEL